MKISHNTQQFLDLEARVDNSEDGDEEEEDEYGSLNNFISTNLLKML